MKRSLLSIVITLSVLCCVNSIALANVEKITGTPTSATFSSVQSGGINQPTGRGTCGAFAVKNSVCSSTYYASSPSNPPGPIACNISNIESSVSMNSYPVATASGTFQEPYSVTFTVADTGGQVFATTKTTFTFFGFSFNWVHLTSISEANNETITVPIILASSGGYDAKKWDTEVPHVIYSIISTPFYPAKYPKTTASNPWECHGGQIIFSIGYTPRVPSPPPLPPRSIFPSVNQVNLLFPAGSVIPKNKIFIDQFAQCFTVTGQQTAPKITKTKVFYVDSGLPNGIKYPYQYILGLYAPSGYTWNFGDGTGSYPGTDPQTHQKNYQMPCQNQSMYPNYMTEHVYRTIDGLGWANGYQGIPANGVTVTATRVVQVYVEEVRFNGSTTQYSCANKTVLGNSIPGFGSFKSIRGQITSSNFFLKCPVTAYLPAQQAVPLGTPTHPIPVKEIISVGGGPGQ